MSELEKTVGYTFQDPKLLELALTHSSYAHEHYAGKRHDNERLEFLGLYWNSYQVIIYFIIIMNIQKESLQSFVRALSVSSH